MDRGSACLALRRGCDAVFEVEDDLVGRAPLCARVEARFRCGHDQTAAPRSHRVSIAPRTGPRYCRPMPELTLADLVENRTMSRGMAATLRRVVAARRSYLVIALPRLAG